VPRNPLENPAGIVAAVAGSVRITGVELDPSAVLAVARHRRRVEISPEAITRMRVAHEVVLAVAARGEPMYGVTTGLGSRVVETVDAASGAEYSLRTLRGRATAVGEPLPEEVVRAAMLVRLNGFCAGGAGTSPVVADGLAAMLNAGVHPVIPSSGSIGASDLCLLAHLGLALVGEGEAVAGGERLPAGLALERAGLLPIRLEAKDGLAICSSSAVSSGAAALALMDAEAALAEAQVSAAVAMEALRANLSPIDPRVVAARSAPGQAWSAQGLQRLLSGAALHEPGAARRLQDPLSFRCASQVHGALRFALDQLSAALGPELNGAADNPLVLADDHEVLSTGNFHVPALALALDAVAIGLAQIAAPLAERGARLRAERVSGLPPSLVAGDTTRSGVAPLGKTAQALVLEIRHAAAPLAVLSGVGADGVEDDSTGATQAALRVREQLARVRRLIAIELLIACQALDLREPVRLGVGTEAAYLLVRELVARLEEDRPLGVDVERLVDAGLARGELLARVQAALD
jgi:histidine ammonia-lyase